MGCDQTGAGKELRESMSQESDRPIDVNKATERARTADLRFTKPLLYQLSYGGDSSERLFPEVGQDVGPNLRFGSGLLVLLDLGFLFFLLLQHAAQEIGHLGSKLLYGFVSGHGLLWVSLLGVSQAQV
jgi:hypothetical protein